MRPGRKSFPLRLSPDVYWALEKWAADELRSVNAQIEYLLTEAVRRAKRFPKRPVRAARTPENSPRG